MPCFSPMLAEPICVSPETGKVQYSFKTKLDCADQLKEKKKLNDGKFYPYKALPCGKCVGCRLDYSKEWAVRCTLEMQDHDKDECYFVTLTYDDEHVPYSVAHTDVIEHQHSYGCFPIDSPVWYEEVDKPSNQTLRPKDLQLFLKLLRRFQDYHYGKKFRYFGCGEYGTKTMRPHYHLILFGVRLSPPAADAWKKNNRGHLIWEDLELKKVWDKGNVIVGRCTYETCGYVARYVLKKQKGNDAKFYEINNIEPPFSRMSLKPAIGAKYYEAHKEEFLASDEIFLETEKKGIKSKPPRYFDKLLSEEYPDVFEGIKDIRSELSLKNVVTKEKACNLPISIILRNAELSMNAKTKILQERTGCDGTSKDETS